MSPEKIEHLKLYEDEFMQVYDRSIDDYLAEYHFKYQNDLYYMICSDLNIDPLE